MSFSGCLLCLNVILFHCRVAIGERTKLPRYAFDPNFKPAIVGSYSYDMVLGKFILPDRNSSTTDINLTDIIFSQPSSTSSPDDIYRKYVGITESKPFNLLRSQLSRNSSNL
ncbi:uncharacterized protein LOC123880223 isoform X1 [Maniola jurtina]|uniref:uncharacterized protein LOC123880223 isoform X1 n=1 Tax=Maniola jurtina TaxID=191418 RepID=UPI001E686BD7|nr:uncharacterized protein LOC123880223 isoform X1 [Maniola jurtina]